MRLEHYKWTEISRRELLGLISARNGDKNLQPRNLSNHTGSLIVAGFEKNTSRKTNSYIDILPSLVILDDEDSNDLFAWLYAFAGDVMPLSMHFQVFLESDAKLIQPNNDRKLNISLWSSVIFGEYLLRGKSSKVMKDFYVGWVETSCSHSFFSFLQRFGSNSDANKIFFSRLRELQNNSRFSFPSLDLDNMEFFWELCLKAEEISFPDNAQYCYQIALEFCSLFDREIKNEIHSVFDIFANSNFRSDSVEQRLNAFDLILSICLADDLLPEIITSFCVGVSAFLVGRGTSHLGLIDRIASYHPTSVLWFSAMAGICGSSSWDPRWFGLMKRIQPRLFDLQSQHKGELSDLSWAEYKWTSEYTKSFSSFKDIIRNSPNSLTLGIMPNVSFQIRFSRENSEVEKNSQETILSESGQTQLGLPEMSNIEILNKIEGLLKDLSKSLQFSDIPVVETQVELNLNVEKRRTRKKAKEK